MSSRLRRLPSASDLLLRAGQPARSQSETPDTHDTQARSECRGLHGVINRIRGKRPVKREQEPDSESDPEHFQTAAPSLVVCFVNTLNAARLSDLIIWYLYHDIVEPPKSPSRWYKPISYEAMRGWIALGHYLATRTSFGLDLVVLSSICDRLRLDKKVLADCLVRLSDPDKMAWTQLAATFQAADGEHMTRVESYELVQIKLQKLRSLASSLTPQEGTAMADWKPLIVQRLREFLDVVVNPKINALREGTYEPFPIQEGSTAELFYLFELIQQRRQVPLVPYGIYPDYLLEMSLSSSSSSAIEVALANEPDLESTFSATSLKDEICSLRARLLALETEKQSSTSFYVEVSSLRRRVSQLEKEKESLAKEKESLAKEKESLTKDNESLAKSNEALAKKLCKTGGNQPLEYNSPSSSEKGEGSQSGSSSGSSHLRHGLSTTDDSTQSSIPPGYEDMFRKIVITAPMDTTMAALPDVTEALPALPSVFPGLPNENTYDSAHTGPAIRHEDSAVSTFPLVSSGLVRSGGMPNLLATPAVIRREHPRLSESKVVGPSVVSNKGIRNRLAVASTVRHEAFGLSDCRLVSPVLAPNTGIPNHMAAGGPYLGRPDTGVDSLGTAHSIDDVVFEPASRASRGVVGGLLRRRRGSEPISANEQFASRNDLERSCSVGGRLDGLLRKQPREDERRYPDISTNF